MSAFLIIGHIIQCRSSSDIHIDHMAEQAHNEGTHPMTYYVREILYLDPKNWESIKTGQLSAVLNACDQLQVIKFAYPCNAIIWPEILIKQKKLQFLYLQDTKDRLDKYSF